MIKKVSLYNFESHQDTTITFNENLNLIVGISNSGKSSLIRAMGVVVNNNWTKDMVRTGCDFCRVTLETERGWVEAERGEKINRWRCKEGDNEIQLFKNVGTKVPDLATKILGMGERDRGGDIKELPNFQFQLEKHYMLSEIGEKKATSNMIARMMDNAIGLGGMEDLIKDISTDLLKDKKWLTEKQNEIIEIKSTIIDEIIFNNYQKLVNEIENKQNKLISLEEDIRIADKYKSHYDICLDNKNKNEVILNNFPDSIKLINLYETVNKLYEFIQKCIKMQQLMNAFNTLSKILDVDVDEIKRTYEQCVKISNSINVCEKTIVLINKSNCLQKILEIETDKFQIKKDYLIELNDKIKDADVKLNNARELWKKKVNSEKELKSIIQELKSVEREFEGLKSKLGVCPLCGTELRGKI